MDPEDKTKIEQIINNRKKAHRFYHEHSEVYRSFETLERTTFKNGSLSRKHKELIALGISIRINCESCVEWHIKQAMDAGAGRDEIIEAIGVGIEMGGGPATVTARLAMHVMEFYSDSD